MALPKRRHSNTRTRKRRTHDKIQAPSLTKCANCGESILTHHLCPSCGYYKGRAVIVKKEKKGKRSKN